VGATLVTAAHTVFADADGVLFAPTSAVPELLRGAGEILATEREQATLIDKGVALFEQLQLDTFIRRRETEPALTFRDHLRKIGGAIEQ